MEVSAEKFTTKVSYYRGERSVYLKRRGNVELIFWLSMGEIELVYKWVENRKREEKSKGFFHPSP